jgi:hypothetical protein
MSPYTAFNEEADRIYSQERDEEANREATNTATVVPDRDSCASAEATRSLSDADKAGALRHLWPGDETSQGTFLSVLLACLLLQGCAMSPDLVRAEEEHTSHPLAGPPFGSKSEEDSLDALNLIARWNAGAWYAETGLGYRIGDGGFYGPRLTFTSRVGREFRVKP